VGLTRDEWEKHNGVAQELVIAGNGRLIVRNSGFRPGLGVCLDREAWWT
jgi:hypothetical protein